MSENIGNELSDSNRNQVQGGIRAMRTQSIRKPNEEEPGLESGVRLYSKDEAAPSQIHMQLSMKKEQSQLREGSDNFKYIH